MILSKYKAAGYKKKLEQIIGGIKLELKEEKTKITKAQEGFEFLGFGFIKAKSRRTGKEVAYVYPSRRSEEKIREKIRRITDYRRTVKVEEIDKPHVRFNEGTLETGQAINATAPVFYFTISRNKKLAGG